MRKSLSLAQCAAVKQLVTLTALSIVSRSWDPDALLELLRPPHALQRLQELPLLRAMFLFHYTEITADDTKSCLQSVAPELRAPFLLQCVRLSAEQEVRLEPPSALLPVLSELTYESL